MGEPDYALAFTLVVIAGMSTCIGSSFVLFERCAKLSEKKLLAASLGLSAGVMVYVSFVEIFQKSLAAFTEQGMEWAYGAATLCFFSGFALTALLDVCVAKIARQAGAEGHGHIHCGTSPDIESTVTSNSEVELVEAGHNKTGEGAPGPKEDEPKQLEKTGVLVALALGLHNLPEGLVTFVATLADPTVGVTLCIAIAIHNVPEGVCVAMPIFYSTGSRKKAFLYSLISGLAEVVGALIGWAFISAAGNAAFGVVFGVVGGMMIYICLSELLPTAFRHDPTNQFVTNYVLLGMLVMALSLVLFSV
jgi:zinc transporter, ZIP family